MPPWLSDALKRFGEDDCGGRAAEITYHLLLASVPALVFLLAMVALWLDPATVQRSVLTPMQPLVPGDVYSLLERMIMRILESTSGGLALVGVLGSLWAGANGAQALIKGLRVTYHSKEAAMGFVRQKARALWVLICLALAVLVAINLLLAGKPLVSLALSQLGLGAESAWMLQAPRWGLMLLLIAGMSTYLYTLVPLEDKSPLSFVQALPGGLVFTTGWLAVSFLFRIYVASFGNYNAVYGALGAMIVLMLWLYLSAMAFLAGAEVNGALARNQKPQNKPFM